MDIVILNHQNCVLIYVDIYCRTFDQLINRASEETRKALIDQTAVNVFVPTEAAFRKIINVPWVNLIYDQALIDKVI